MNKTRTIDGWLAFVERAGRAAVGVGLLVGFLAGLEQSVAEARVFDYGALTCRDFLGSGKDSMAVIIWWLRGHHAGKTGIDSFNSEDAYAARLGRFCGNHPTANLIETSERILADLERGI